MAAAYIPAEGSEVGPCVESCEHTDCAATRALSKKICDFCKQPIGFDSYYYETDTKNDVAHRLCYEVAIAEGRA